MAAKRDVVERFLEKIDFGTGCWEWMAARRTGYGAFAVPPKRVLPAHRFAYELMRGPIPDGLVIDHLCRNRGCVNPWHLEVVTNRVNILRGTGWSGRHARVTHCPKGHEYTEVNIIWRSGGRRRNCRTCEYARTARKNDAAYWRGYRARRKVEGRPLP